MTTAVAGVMPAITMIGAKAAKISARKAAENDLEWWAVEIAHTCVKSNSCTNLRRFPWNRNTGKPYAAALEDLLNEGLGKPFFRAGSSPAATYVRVEWGSDAAV